MLSVVSICWIRSDTVASFCKRKFHQVTDTSQNVTL